MTPPKDAETIEVELGLVVHTEVAGLLKKRAVLGGKAVRLPRPPREDDVIRLPSGELFRVYSVVYDVPKQRYVVVDEVCTGYLLKPEVPFFFWNRKEKLRKWLEQFEEAFQKEIKERVALDWVIRGRYGDNNG